MSKAKENRARLQLGSLRLDASAQAALLGYAWPGNVRELEHLISRAVLKALSRAPSTTNTRDSSRPRMLSIGLEDLWDENAPPAPVPAPPGWLAVTPNAVPAVITTPAPVAPTLGLRDSTERHERQLIEASLARHGGSWAAAARELQLDRGNLQRMAKRLGIERH